MHGQNTATEISPFHCPITLAKFRDPVVAEDGHTYERDAIVKWLEDNNKTSPKTRQLLNVKRLIPNLLVKQLIDDQFEATLRKQNYQYKLGDDIKRLNRLFVAFGKSIHAAEWIKKPDGPPIILMTISGAQALKEAMFYVEMSKHPHIVRTYGLVDKPDEAILVQERAQRGDLFQLLEEREQPPSEIVLREIFLQVADGMSFLAHNNVVHGDLACRNILVFKFDERDPKETLVKVTDFGLSRESSIYKSISTSAHTTLNILPYRSAAPEILQNPDLREVRTEKSDMYSMGVLMWEAYSLPRKQPWSHIKDDMDVRLRVIKGERLQQPPTCSKNMWSLIQTTMSQQPNDRPTFAALHRQLIELNIEIETPPQVSYNVQRALKAIEENSEMIILSQTRLCDDEMKIIAKKLMRNETVCCLDLRQNQLSNGGTIAIAEMLEVNKTINKVILDQNSISSEAVKPLARALTINKTLISLNIGRNPLSDDGVQAICEALKTNQTLKTLHVNETRISTIGIQSIADMLRVNTTLQGLAMGTNTVTDDGAILIAEALKINTSLTWLHMGHSGITDKGALSLAEAIKAHQRRIGYFFLADDSPISDNGRNAVKDALRVNATKYH